MNGRARLRFHPRHAPPPRPAARLGVAATAAVALGLGGAEPTARAEWVLGLEPTASMMIDDAPRFGPSLAASLGYSLDLYPLLLMPELCVAGAVYPGSDLYGIGRLQPGVRLGVTAAVEPAAYLRVGYGLGLGPDEPAHGVAIDAGAALEGRLSRELTLGGLFGYQGLVAGEGSHHGMVAGLRLGIWF